MSAPVLDRIDAAQDIEEHVSDIKALAFLLQQLVMAASADNWGASWTERERDRFERGTGLLVGLIDDIGQTVVNLAFHNTPDERSLENEPTT
jgi:hypothetical protein